MMLIGLLLLLAAAPLGLASNNSSVFGWTATAAVMLVISGSVMEGPDGSE